jgi:hypothetical protein
MQKSTNPLLYRVVSIETSGIFWPTFPQNDYEVYEMLFYTTSAAPISD